MLESRDKKIPRRFREDLKMLRVSPRPTLNTSWISKASASQRRGRAGRTKSWHPSVAQGGTWEARGSWCFNVFHGLSRSSACWNNCLQLFTWRYPSHFVNCSSCRNAVCFGTPTNSFKAVQHPVQAVILKDLAGMKVYSSAACQGFTNFFQLSHY